MTWEMDMDEVLGLVSCETGKTMRETLEGGHVRLDGPIDCARSVDATYERLHARMAEDGINKVPVWVDDDGVCNGHHRVAIGWELGFARMRVTDSAYESGWGDGLSGRII